MGSFLGTMLIYYGWNILTVAVIIFVYPKIGIPLV